jgi:hypothetical protein
MNVSVDHLKFLDTEERHSVTMFIRDRRSFDWFCISSQQNPSWSFGGTIVMPIEQRSWREGSILLLVEMTSFGHL